MRFKINNFWGCRDAKEKIRLIVFGTPFPGAGVRCSLGGVLQYGLASFLMKIEINYDDSS